MSLLGGKYSQAEQATPGLIQTFRARDLATGEPVFVHRINDANCEQQASLLKLLLLSLYRSPAVEKLVLEVREEEDACYVVTESAPQCFLLREWLELEARAPEGEIREFRELESPEPKPADLSPSLPESELSSRSPWGHDRTGDELSLSAPFVSEAQAAVPQAAPIKSIRPLPPDFSPATQSPRSQRSDPFASSPGMASKSGQGTLVVEEIEQEAGELKSPRRMYASAPNPLDEASVAPSPVQKNVACSPAYSPNPAVQRPGGALPLDEFSRLFADAQPAPHSRVGPAAELLSAVHTSAPETVPPARPAANSLTGNSTPVPLLNPIMPSAAQTVLESALAAQAASQRNRNLIVGIVVVVLIIAAVVLMMLTFSRTQ